MNFTYRLIWDADPTSARSGEIELRIAHIAYPFALALFAPAAYAAPPPTELPGGGQVSAGQASIAVDGAHMDVNQTSQNAAINWQTFNIGQDAQVDFHQPNSSAIAVNRIADTNGSQIMGKLNANGQIYLINPNGILFGQGAQVNVGGLVASTLDADGSETASGKRTFSGSSAANEGTIVNQGSITAAEGGYVALLGGQASNQGVIQARLGTVALAAGDKVSLEFAGDKLLNVEVDKGALHALAENKQLIQADGGMVLMTAKAADALLSTAVNNEGVIEARTVEDRNGVIKLLGDMDSGTVNVGGSLDASVLPSPSGREVGGEGANGGFIETSAAHVKIADDVKITTKSENGNNGTWLIDPVDFTIAASGGDITGAVLTQSLNGTNVTIQSTDGAAGTAGDVNVNDAVSWSGNKLTLNAQNDININANLNASGTASLALEYGQGAVAAGNASNYYLSNGAKVNLPAGNNFSTKLGSDGLVTNYTVITSLGAAGSVTGTDLQGMNGNLAGNYVLGADIDASATAGWNAGAGFAPVGSLATQFTGNFSGLGHTITGLTINRLATAYVGLFGYAGAGSTLRDVGLLNSNISGQVVVGSLAGRSNGVISYSYADGGSVITDQNIAGGLVGQIGGSVGYSYANVAVNGNSNGVNSTAIGGLVGSALGGSIGNSYATGSVNGGVDVGGLVGQVSNGATVTNAYSTGVVTWSIGGGGLVGAKGGTGTVTNSYWDTTTSGVLGSAAGTGLTTAQMQTMSSFAGWDIANSGGSGAVWRIYEGSTAPLLRGFLTLLSVTANDASKTYDGNPYSGGNGVAYSVAPNANLLGTVGYGGSSQGAVNAGNYTISASGLYSNQRGYDISYVDGAMTIDKAALTVTANDASKTYDSLAWSGGNGVSYTGFVNGETAAVLGGTLAYGGASQGAVDVGTYAITPSGLNSGNYTISYANGTLTVNKANATVTANSGTFTYNGLNQSISGFTATGLVNGETTAVLTGVSAYGSGTDAGSYATTASGSATNYNLIFVPGTLTIAKALLTAAANNAGKNYDGLAYSGGNGMTYTGFVNGETSAVLGGTLAYGGSSQGAVNAGSYAIVPSGLASANYAISYVQAKLAVTPATLTYTASPASFFTGQSPSGLSGTVNGFAPGDTLENSTTGSLSWTTTAGTTSQPGLFPISGGGLTLTTNNYSLVQAPGNGSALTLKPSRPPVEVLNAMALLEANLLPPPSTPDSSATMTLVQTDAVPNTRHNTAIPTGMSSTLTIMPPGMKLPDHALLGEDENE